MGPFGNEPHTYDVPPGQNLVIESLSAGGSRILFEGTRGLKINDHGGEVPVFFRGADVVITGYLEP